MSVVGIDLGTNFSKVAVAHRKKIDMVPNELAKLATSTLIGFTEKERQHGEAAISSWSRNLQSTISQITRFLGRQYNDPNLQEELQRYMYCETKPLEDGRIGFVVNTSQGVLHLSAEQILSGFLRSLKQFTSVHLDGVAVKDCVLSCPTYFDDAQRRALLTGARLAELNVLRLMNSSTAIALNYGILRQLPKDETRRVVFVDVGYANTEVAVVDFVQGKLEIFSTASNAFVGARDFDYQLYQHFSSEFTKKHKIDLNDRKRAKHRMLKDCQRLKKVLSGNRDAVIPIECLTDDIDFEMHITRDDFEGLCEGLLDSIEATVKAALVEMHNKDVLLLEKKQKKIPKIHSVEIVGGGRCIPCVQNRILQVFKDHDAEIDKLMFTLNGDESVARGCTLMCAMLSPSFKVREFQVQDINTWPVTIRYPSDKDASTLTQQLVLARGNPSPCTAKVTFTKNQSFSFSLRHTEEMKSESKDASSVVKFEYPMATQRAIGEFELEVPPLSEELVSDPKIKLLLSLNRHGILDHPNASLIEFVKRPPEEDKKPAEPMDVDKKAEAASGDDAAKPEDKPEAETSEPASADDAASATASEPMDTDEPKPADAEKKEDTPAAPEKKKKDRKKVIRQLNVKGRYVSQPTDGQFNQWMELEAHLVNQDRVVRETAEKHNELESYVYDMRSRLEGSHREFIAEADREKFMSRLNEIEDWLYGDGEDAQKSAYLDRLKELHTEGDAVMSRQWESEHRPHRIEQFKKLIIRYQQFPETTDEQYAHITAEKRKEVFDAANKADEWLSNKMIQQDRLEKFNDPAVKCASIDQQYRALMNKCQPIITEPKPQPKPEPKEEEAKEEKPAEEAASGDKPAEEASAESGDAKPAEEAKPEEAKPENDEDVVMKDAAQ